jgi:drug/metabolite transporter (DMT)-like permease
MSETIGALCALGSAVSWSVTSLMVRTLAPGIGTFTINAARTTLTAGIVVGWTLIGGGLERVLTLSATSLALLAVSIVLAVAIGDTIFFESTQRLGLGRAMTISMSYPVVAASLAALLLGEPLTAPIVLGGVLTLGGLALIVAARVEPPREPRAWRGVVEASAAALAWGVSVVALRVPLDEIDPISAQAIRLPLGAVLLWVTPWAWRGRAEAPARRLAADRPAHGSRRSDDSQRRPLQRLGEVRGRGGRRRAVGHRSAVRRSAWCRRARRAAARAGARRRRDHHRGHRGPASVSRRIIPLVRDPRHHPGRIEGHVWRSSACSS